MPQFNMLGVAQPFGQPGTAEPEVGTLYDALETLEGVPAGAPAAALPPGINPNHPGFLRPKIEAQKDTWRRASGRDRRPR